MADAPRVTDRLSLLSIVNFSVATFPVSALGVALFVYLPPYLAGHLGVPLATVGLVWAMVRGLDLVVDPVLGQLMDRTVTPFGRYRAWLACGVPILMLGVYMLFMAPKGIGAGYVLFWLLFLYLGNSILALSQWAWGATLAKEYHERSRVFGVLTAVGVSAGVITLLIPVIGPLAGLDSDASVRAMGWFIIALAPVTVGLTFLRTPEHLNADVTEQFKFADYLAIVMKPEVIRLFLCQMALTLGPGWMSAMYLFYARDIWGFTTQQATILLLAYILAGIVGAPVTARVARRIGKHQTLMVTTTAFSIGLLGVLVPARGNMLAALPVMLWCGFMATGFGFMTNAMMADVGDEVRLHQGKERMSLLYSVLTFAAKIAAAGAISLTFPLLAVIGFNATEGAYNTPSALSGLQWVFVSGPIVFVLLGGLSVWGWKLDAVRHAEVRRQLDARDGAASVAAD
jgi:Na+/melibiose symporter-like transporter